jgi:hypothetical protein
MDSLISWHVWICLSACLSSFHSESGENLSRLESEQE